MGLVSADGRWWWNGESWRPRPESVKEEAAHAESRNGAGAFTPACYDRSAAMAPPRGFSGRLRRLSRGRINLGPSAAKQQHLSHLASARTPATDPPLHVAVASAKGGVGKSTMALLLASKMGLLRIDRIIAVECNPHHGTFRSRIRSHHDRSVKDLIDFLDGSQVARDEDLTLPMLHRFTTHVPESRLEVITAPTDPKIRHALSVEDYRRVFRVLERYFDVIVLDLGTGLLDETTRYILDHVCDQLVVVAPAELDGAELGAFTLEFVAGSRGLDWVRQRGVVVVNRVVKDTEVDVAGMETYFRGWARACIRIGQDPHLKTGGIFDWNRISRAASQQILAMTAEVGRGLALGRSS